MSEALDHVSTLVLQISGARHVEASVRVHHDLGIAGDDATRLLQEMTSKFSVSFEGFEFARFFPSETEAFDAQIADLIGLGGQRQPLTVQHLAHRALELKHGSERIDAQPDVLSGASSGTRV